MSTQLLPSPAPAATDTPGVRDLMAQLLSIPPGVHRVISCFVQLGPDERATQSYRLWFKERSNALLATLASEPSRVLRLAIERDLARLAAFLEGPEHLPHARGLACYACEELSLFRVVALPSVTRNRLILDDTPWIRELVNAEREFAPITVVAIDRKHARFFQVSAWTTEEQEAQTSTVTPAGRFHGDRGDPPGWGERSYHARIEQERHRHYAAAAHDLEEIRRSGPSRGIVVVGPSEHANAFIRFLPPRLAAAVIGTAQLNPTSVTIDEIREAAFSAAAATALARTTRALATLQEAFGTGWGVNGVRETLRALNKGQVRQLYFRAAQSGGGYRCGSLGHLVLSPQDCTSQTEIHPVQDLTDEVVEEALRHGVAITPLVEPALAAQIDGYAAVLRFRD